MIWLELRYILSASCRCRQGAIHGLCSGLYTKPSLVFVSKWDTKNKILDAIVSQESVDSITNRGLVERGFDSNYLIARYFTPQNREAARNIIGIDKNGYEYIKDDSIVNAIRKVITGIDAKAAAKLKVEPFPGYQKIFTLPQKYFDSQMFTLSQIDRLSPQALIVLSKYDIWKEVEIQFNFYIKKLKEEIEKRLKIY